MTAYVMSHDLRNAVLPQYTSFGCYTILHVLAGTDTCLCAACATKAFLAGKHLVHSTYDEGEPIECEGEDCDTEIESSYGPCEP